MARWTWLRTSRRRNRVCAAEPVTTAVASVENATTARSVETVATEEEITTDKKKNYHVTA
jgi:hypothetical protein